MYFFFRFRIASVLQRFGDYRMNINLLIFPAIIFLNCWLSLQLNISNILTVLKKFIKSGAVPRKIPKMWAKDFSKFTFSADKKYGIFLFEIIQF